MEDDLKILKVWYLNNHLDLPQIWNLSLGDLTRIQNSLQWRIPPMEDALNLWEVEYLSNHLLDLPQLLNLSQGTKPELKISVIKTTSDGKLPQVETKIENYMKSKTTLKHFWPSARPPHPNQRNFSAHMSEKSPLNISPNRKEVIPKVLEP